MSGRIRTSIAQASKALKHSINQASSFLDKAENTTTKENSDSEITEHLQKVFDERSILLKPYRRLEKHHNAFEELKTDSPNEVLTFDNFIAKHGDYRTLLNLATELLNRFDTLVTKYITEGRSRKLPLSDIIDEHNEQSSQISTDSFQQKTGTVETTSKAVPPKTNSTTDVANHTNEPLFANHGPSAFTTAALLSDRLPKFSGDILKWPSFIESFQSLISQGGVRGVDRLSMLKMCVQGEAKQIISGLTSIDHNFETALHLLKMEYDHPIFVQQTLLNRIRDLSDCQNCTSLRPFYLSLNALVQQLLPDGTLEGGDTYLINSILGKLPTSMSARIAKDMSKRQVTIFTIMDILQESVETERFEQLFSKHNARSKDTYSPAAKPRQVNRLFSAPTHNQHRASNTKTCQLCDGNHSVFACTQYATPLDRKKAAFQLKLCSNCLSPSHLVKECRSRRRCQSCQETHHTSTCEKLFNRMTPQTTERTPPSPNPKYNCNATSGERHRNNKQMHPRITHHTSTNCAITQNSNVVPMKKQQKLSSTQKTTAPVYTNDMNPSLAIYATLFNPKHHELLSDHCVVLFDCGSTISYIDENLVTYLGLETSDRRNLKVTTFHTSEPQMITSTLHILGIKCVNGDPYYLPVHSTDFIIPEISWMAHTSGITPTLIRSRPQILLGQDTLFDLFFNNITTSDLTSELRLLHTTIGDIVNFKKSNSTMKFMTMVAEVTECSPTPLHDDIPSLEQLEKTVDSYLSLESVGVLDTPEATNEDQACLEQFRKTIRYDKEEKRYYVQLPFKKDPNLLPSNFGLAFGRLRNNYDQLTKSGLIESYDANFREQIERGILEEVPYNEIYKDTGCHYLAHFGVQKQSNETTKLRSVLDGSAKSRNSFSLNDCLFRGPVILPDLIGILLRTRTAPILISADIEKAFLMVGLEKASRDFTRLLWVRDIHQIPCKQNLVVYRFRRVPFGLNTSPFLLAGTILHHMERNPSSIGDRIRDMLYVDNMFGLAETEHDGEQMFHDSRKLFKDASMCLRKFVSNNQNLNDLFRQHDAASENTNYTKVLGLTWNTSEDIYSLPPFPSLPSMPWTKRKALYYTASLFDPLGFVTPATLPLKIFLQGLWKEKLGWDDSFPIHLMKSWNSIIAPLTDEPATITVPRLCLAFSTDECTFELHAFTDASQVAYSAVVYLVTRRPDNSTHVKMILAKARVAPSKCSTTIPRMELLGTLLGAELLHKTISEIRLPIGKTYLWTDSMVCLFWIRSISNDRLPIFVRNRITKIQTLIPKTEIRHVNGDNNPADCASRGCTFSELGHHKLWWQGPNFLRLPSQQWPTQPVEIADVSCLLTQTTTRLIPCIDISRFSKWTKLVGVMRMVLIFIQKAARKPIHSPADLTELSERKLFSIAQQASPPHEKQSSILRLYFNHQTNLLHSLGRIDNCQLDEKARRPIFLPHHPITKLFCLHTHQLLAHAGVEHCVRELRQRVWIPNIRKFVKQVNDKLCMTCIKNKAKPYVLPDFPQHPEIRINTPNHQFQHVGMDMTGPIAIRKNDGTTEKAWILLITCINVRCIYLDVLCDLSTATLLSRIRRFVATHGAPATIICDNATAFKALKDVQQVQLVEALPPEIIDFCARQKIDYHFITPYSPWSGGFYERLIGLTKSSLKSTIGRRTLDLETFTTLVKETEAIINSRPLTYMASGTELLPLRPIDFLRPNAQISLPRFPKTDRDDPDYMPRLQFRDHLINSWQQQSQMLDQLWKRWVQEYITSLRERNQHQHPHGRLVNKKKPKLNDIVLIADENLKRGQWRIGQICGSKNNLERSAIVRVANGGTLSRPISLLHKMEIDKSESDENDEPQNPPNSNDQTSQRPAIRNRMRANNHIVSLTTLVMLLLLPISSAATDSRCRDETELKIRMLYMTPCTQHGIGIAQATSAISSEICWTTMRCPSGVIQPLKFVHKVNINHCGPPCQCPNWTSSCSNYDGKFRKEWTREKLPTEITEYVPPQVCSFNKESHCSPQEKFGFFNRIALFDGTLLIVPNMNVATSEVYRKDDFRCFNPNGTESFANPPEVTGTIAFCRYFSCSEAAETFCFYGSPITTYKFKELQIPIAAWGTIRRKYFPHPPAGKSNSMQLAICSTGGIELKPYDHPQTIQVCIPPICTLIESTESIDPRILLPSSLVATPYEVTITAWENGFEMTTQKLLCPASLLCDSINCLVCYNFMMNYQCWSFSHQVMGVGTAFLLISFLAFLCNTCMIISRIINIFRRVVIALFQCVCRIFRGQQVSLPFKPYRRKRYFSIATILTILSPFANSCSEVTSLTATESNCIRSANGTLSCTISETTLLALRPIGLPTCLTIQNSNGTILGTLSLQVSRIEYKCNKQTLFYTRNHKLEVHSQQLCGPAFKSGTCKDEYNLVHTCAKIQNTDKLKMFEKINNHPGYTYCQSSCGCTTCGCFTCTASCLMYRIIALPEDDEVFEAYRCLNWQNEFTLQASLATRDGISEKTFHLQPGISSRWNDIVLTIVSSSHVAFENILTQQYLTNGIRTALMENVNPGIQTPFSAGQLQCQTREDAIAFNCYFSPHACQCSPAMRVISCHCPSGRITSFFGQTKLLPLERDGISLQNTPSGSLVAIVNNHAVLQLQVRMQEMTLKSTWEETDCRTEASTVEGCFSWRVFRTPLYVIFLCCLGQSRVPRWRMESQAHSQVHALGTPPNTEVLLRQRDCKCELLCEMPGRAFEQLHTERDPEFRSRIKHEYCNPY